ncbi:MAG: response regulator [Bacteroidales bacterium]|nr:response regulator [Bacteroidales bacterium]MDY0216345.1 response regulator [Bacteroidales bacterium]
MDTIIKAVIIDDELHARESLKMLLQEKFEQVEVCGISSNCMDGLKIIKAKKPDVVFLDIHMPEMSGLEFLDIFDFRDFLVVFTTAYNNHAIEAIKKQAFDYLLKPIDEDELDETIHKILFKLKSDKDALSPNLEQTIKSMIISEKVQKVTLPYSKGYKVVNVDDIVMFKGNNNYSDIHLIDGSVLLSSKTLLFFETKFSSLRFFRIHKSFLINLVHIKEMNFKDGGAVTLSNKEVVPIARGKSAELMQLINGINLE